MQELNDEKIKNLVKSYISEEKNLDEIIEYLSLHIYNYPRIAFRAEDDACGEFYLYFCDRLPKILFNYRETKSKFITWLFVVLRNSYINWLNKENRQKLKTVMLNEEIQYDFSYDEHKDEDDFLNENRKKTKIINEINELPLKVKAIIKLHYYDFFEPEDIIEISKVFKIDVNILIEKLNSFLDKLAVQNEKKIELLDKITLTYNKIQKLKENNKNKDKVKEMKEKHLNLVKSYQSFYISLQNKDIAKLLNVSHNTVSNLLFRGRVMLNKKLGGLI